MYIKYLIKIGILLCIPFALNAQYAPHHSVAELTTDGGFETGGRGSYRVNSSTCYDAFAGNYYVQMYNGSKTYILLKEKLSSGSVYNLSFRMRRGLKQYKGADDVEGFQCDDKYPCKGDFDIYLSDEYDGSGNNQKIGSYEQIHQTYWKLVEKTIIPDRSTYQFIVIVSKSNGIICENHVAIDDVSLQECGVQTCSRTAGKINKPTIACSSCTPTIDNNSIFEITNNLDNVSKLTVQYGGATKIVKQNPNGIKRFATNGSEFGFSSGGQYTLKFILENDCDRLEFTQKILYSCVNTSISMTGKNNHRPNDPSIPRYQCADYLTVTSNYLPQDNIFGARVGLSTSGSVVSNSSLTLVAGNYVRLNEGFSTSSPLVVELRQPGSGLKSDILYDEMAIEEEIADNLETIEPEVEQEEVLVEDLPVEIVLSPNPTKGILRINLSREVDFELEVYSKSGTSLLRERNPETVDLSGFPSDLYYVKIRIGDAVTMNKVIKL